MAAAVGTQVNVSKRVAAQAVGLAFLVNSLVGFLLHWPCRNSGYTDSRFTALCYSDLAAAFANPPFLNADWPFGGDTAAALAPLPAMVTWLVSAVSADFLTRMVLLQLILAACLMLVAGLVFHARHWRRLDAALLLVLPLWPFVMFVATDLLAVAGVAAALFAWQRGRHWWAGIAAGCALASGAWTWLVLVAVVVDGIRNEQRRRAAQMVAVAVVVSAGLALPRLLAGMSLLIPINFEPGEGSPLFILRIANGDGPNGLILAGFGIAIVLAIAQWAVRLPFDFRLEPLLALLICVQLITSPGIQPQSLTHLLWLLPLVLPRFKFGLIFSVIGFGYVLGVWMRLEGQTANSHGLSNFPYAMLAAALWIELLWVAMICRRVIAVQGEDEVRISRAVAQA